MTKHAAEVFEAVAAAFERDFDEGDRTLFGFMADRIEYRHEPPLPSDGMVDRDHLRNGATAELEVFRAAIPDFRIEHLPVRREGDDIVVEYRLRGTTAAGRAVDFPGRMIAVVVDGRIQRLTAVLDGDPSVLTDLLADHGIGRSVSP